MPLQLWVAIVGVALSAMWAITWYTFRRHITRVDELVKHMFEPDGRIDKLDCSLRTAIASRVTEEDLDLNLSPLTRQLEEIVQEGRDREERILEAVKGSRSEQQEGQKQVRSDITGIHARIDGLYDRTTRPTR